MCNNMVCLSIFKGSVVTYVYLVCLFVYLTFYSFCILFIFILVKTFFFKTKKIKCKVLEIIPNDLDRNCYEIIAFVCLWMLSNVPTTNVAISGDEQVHITKGVQTIDANVSDEKGSGGNKGENEL